MTPEPATITTQASCSQIPESVTRHTSNGLAYLREQVPDYSEAATYIDAPAVRDHGLITASGLSDVEFAREIMAELDVLSEDDRDRWAKLFRGGRIPSGAF